MSGEKKISLLGQFIEMWGISWPGRDKAPEAEPPRCAACHNPAARSGDQWRCPHHPEAGVVEPEARTPS